MGMGMSVHPQIWQQFVGLVFQDDLIKCKQNFDVIMDDTFIHLTAEDIRNKRAIPTLAIIQIRMQN